MFSKGYKHSLETVLWTSIIVIFGSVNNSYADSGSFYADPFPKIHVKAESNTYSELQTQPSAFYGAWTHLQADAGVIGKITHWGISLKYNTTTLWFGDEAVQGTGAKSIDKTVWVSPAIDLVESTVVGLCNGKAEQLRSQGQSDEVIFASPHSVYLNAEYHAFANGPSNKSVYEHDQAAAIEVVCDAYVPPVNYAGSYASIAQLTDADIFIAPAYTGLSVQCPSNVPATVQFQGTGPVNLQYRLVNAMGFASPLGQITLQAHASGNYRASEDIQIPIPTPWLPVESGSGGVVNNSMGDFGTAVPNPDPVIPPTGAASGMGQYIGSEEAVHAQSWRVEVISPVEMQSQSASYHITCLPAEPNVAFDGLPNDVQTTLPANNPQSANQTGQIALGTETTNRPTFKAMNQAPEVAQLQLPKAKIVAMEKAELEMAQIGINLGQTIPWGSRRSLMATSNAFVAQSGRNGEFCRFSRVAVATSNAKGKIASGAFINKVFVNDKLVKQINHATIAAGKLAPPQYLTLDLVKGVNLIRIELDANKQVPEMNENNAYKVTIDLRNDCAGPKRQKSFRTQPPVPDKVESIKPSKSYRRN